MFCWLHLFIHRPHPAHFNYVTDSVPVTVCHKDNLTISLCVYTSCRLSRYQSQTDVPVNLLDLAGKKNLLCISASAQKDKSDEPLGHSRLSLMLNVHPNAACLASGEPISPRQQMGNMAEPTDTFGRRTVSVLKVWSNAGCRSRCEANRYGPGTEDGCLQPQSCVSDGEDIPQPELRGEKMRECVIWRGAELLYEAQCS